MTEVKEWDGNHRMMWVWNEIDHVEKKERLCSSEIPKRTSIPSYRCAMRTSLFRTMFLFARIPTKSGFLQQRF